MTATNWPKCCAVTLDYEGGNDNDPHDPGGRTSRGILQREWNTYVVAHRGSQLPADVWKAPQSAILDIYRTQYWNPIFGDQWPAGVDLCVYDAGVNSGLGQSVKWARAALAQGQGTFGVLAKMATATGDKVAVIKRYQAKRLGFLENLGTWRYFGRGWAKRVAGIEAIAVKMALEASGKPAEIVHTDLADHGRKAAQRANSSGGGAIALPTVATATRVTVEHTDWTHYVATGAVILLTTAVVAFLLFQWYTNRARAAAYAKVLTK